MALQPTFSSTLEDDESIDLNAFSPLDMPGLLIWMDASNESTFDINQSTNAIIEWNNSVIGQGYNLICLGQPDPEVLHRKMDSKF